MNFSNLRISAKCGLGFGAVLLMVAGIGLASWSGIGQIVGGANEVIVGNKLRGELLQREVDHLSWAGNVNRFVLDDGAATLAVQKDPTQCGFGKWYYSERRTEAESELPAIREALGAIDAPHRELHASAVEVEQAKASGGQQAAIAVYKAKTAVHLAKVQSSLHEVLQTVSKSVMTDEKMLSDARSTKTTVLALVAACVVLGVVLSGFITRAIVVPTRKSMEFARRMASGDLTARIELDQSDEIGMLAKSLNEMAGSVKTMVTGVGDGMGRLSGSAGELTGIAETLLQSTGQSSTKAQNVAAAASQMSGNLGEVTTSIETTNQNMTMVAAAAEELTATIHEIAKRAAHARTVSEDAITATREVERLIDTLVESSDKIGRITGQINEISEQTKLLALNATIESARAGEAGKGFAVVAGEIKELAKQVANATSDISGRIQAMKTATGATREGIGRISGVISDVNETVLTIAAAIEEQSVTVNEIARNTQEVSTAVARASRMVGESSATSAHVASDIDHLSRETDAIAGTTGRLEDSAKELRNVAEELKAMTSRFAT